MEKIGKIVNTHGIKGELKVSTNSDFTSIRFKKGAIIFIEYDSKFLEFIVENSRVHKNHILLTLKDYYDINLVEKYKTCFIFQDLEEVDLEEDEFHYNDLIGMKVKSDTGEFIGEVVDLLNYPAQDLLVVKTSSKEVMIPFVKEIVISVEEEIIVHVIEGLL